MPFPLLLAAPAMLKALPWKWIGIGAGLLVAAAGAWWVYDSIGDRREAEVVAKQEAIQRAAARQAQADTIALVDSLTGIDTTLLIDLDTIRVESVPALKEIQYVTKDRPIYRDVRCAADDSVLNAANKLRAATRPAAPGGDGAAVPGADDAP